MTSVVVRFELPLPRHFCSGIEFAHESGMPMAPEPNADAAKPDCPECRTREARTVLRLPPVVYVRCSVCECVWCVPDRRKGYRTDELMLRTFSDTKVH
jgi:hypothetical protein